jgi:preprotein translocase subunit YajC
LVLLVILMYFMLIRPQMKRAKDHRNLLAALSKGDEVMTNGGIAGKVRDVGETFVLLEIAKDVQVRMQKAAISSVLPKGTLDTL